METTDLSEVVGKLIPNPYFISVVKEIKTGRYYSIIGKPSEIATLPSIPEGFTVITNTLITL